MWDFLTEAFSDIIFKMLDKPIKIGDKIQWTISGTNQFKTPRKVIKTDEYEGEVYLFVEGTNTGIPASQATVVNK